MRQAASRQGLRLKGQARNRAHLQSRRDHRSARPVLNDHVFDQANLQNNLPQRDSAMNTVVALRSGYATNPNRGRRPGRSAPSASQSYPEEQITPDRQAREASLMWQLKLL